MSHVPIDTVLEHPELFKAYPQLRNYQFQILPHDSWYAGSAHHGPGTPHLALRSDKLTDESVMLHEMQHPIQHFENFARGGSPDLAQIKKSPFEQDLTRLDKEHADVLRAVEKMPLGDPQFHAQLNKLIELGDKSARAQFLNRKYMEARKIAAHENYGNLAGEVEARNVQTRWGLSPVDVYNNTAPWITEDVPRSNQIISFESQNIGPRVKTGQGNILLDPSYERY